MCLLSGELALAKGDYDLAAKVFTQGLKHAPGDAEFLFGLARAYAPWVDMEAELRRHDEPLRSLETWRPLSEFDVVGLSPQRELTFPNVLAMLDLGRIPSYNVCYTQLLRAPRSASGARSSA